MPALNGRCSTAIDTHIADGYELVFVPHMLSWECGYTSGQFPKFEDEVFWLENAEDERRRFMLPTAETALVSLHRDEILREDELPRKYISYTPCFRREAGSYRTDERGMVRATSLIRWNGAVTKPEDSTRPEELWLSGSPREGAGSPNGEARRRRLLASMARTYDIETKSPPEWV